jgi:hypothetical protein
MPKDQRRRQQKLLKKLRKSKAKAKEHRRAGALDAAIGAVRNARRFPLLECLICESWREHGLANILIAREQPEGLVVFGVFLIDTGCLGVKNAFCNGNITRTTYREFRQRFQESNDAIPCAPALAHEIVYGGLDYAAAIGFKPHKDFDLARHVLEPRDAYPFDGKVEFGKDGKPFYVSGPNDNINRILNHLEKTLGPGNFHFIAGGPVGEPLDDSEEIDDELGETN